MTISLTANSHTYYNDNTTPGGMGNGQFRTNLFLMLGDIMTDVGRGPYTSIVGAVAIGTLGTVALTMAAAILLTPGGWVVVASQSSPTSWMAGQVTARTGTAVTVTFTMTGGTPGSFSDCAIALSGPPGATGSVSQTITAAAALAFMAMGCV